MTGESISTWAAVRLQWRVLGALMIREMYTRFGRENLGFLWLMGEPILFIGGVILMRSMLDTGPAAHGVSIVAIAATGYPPLVMWRNSISRCLNCLRYNYGLLYHRQVMPSDIMISRIALEIAGVILAALAFYVVGYLAGIVTIPYDIGLFAIGWVFHIWFSLASGLFIGALSELSIMVEKVIHVFTYLWLPIGGSFYMVFWLPYKFRDYATAIPSTSAYEIMRSGYFGPGVPTYYNLPALISTCLVLTVIGLGLIKYARRKMILE